MDNIELIILTMALMARRDCRNSDSWAPADLVAKKMHERGVDPNVIGLFWSELFRASRAVQLIN